MRTRFAPSPTGDLHLGGVWTALASWAFARAVGGSIVLRVEDINPPRVVRGATARILEDLTWLGLDWDEGPILQSTRSAAYIAALEKLDTYPCDCSRAEIARVASAPHAGEEVVYPGTCRDAPPDREMRRAPAIRLRVPDGARVVFDDLVRGHIEEDVARVAGDFVLRRGDGVFAYQLAVSVDDAEMGITDVVRADDLLSSTTRQIFLMQQLGFAVVPRYGHLPLVVAANGERLAKRTNGALVRELRDQMTAEAILGVLAGGLGLTGSSAPQSARQVAANLRPPSEWRREPWRLSSGP